MLPFGPDEASNALNAVQQTFYMAVHDHNFKKGAFKDQITKSTSALEAADVLLASNLLTKEEKEPIRKMRTGLAYMVARGPLLTSDEAMISIANTFEVTNIFDADRKEQGQYVPPMMMYSMGKDDKVTKSFAITDDGVEETAGGEIGQVPGAPKEYNRRQKEHWHELSGKNRGQTQSQDGAAGGKSERLYEKESGTKTDQKTTNSDKGKEGSDFGGDFKKNLRGAFL
ncbi:hypothetical protein H2202_009856 [Exophiala xenobiotica]|nr:hypothetical protein H2202_009856 [Exophiala xenobiotica]KAK5199475.1 hypothetical protein LTR92_000014 [Exophiala xenobiotica]KAK5210641.1 hypothetical protein LTR41_003251 [Exophiala xenobiotica]KAK5225029.1 hypothetical protein LTR72_004812 [Exophiala xenobiotica]KAK5237097.1 hypothetical protein LTR47_001361 [Exophiala xenobiotica]